MHWSPLLPTQCWFTSLWPPENASSLWGNTRFPSRLYQSTLLQRTRTLEGSPPPAQQLTQSGNLCKISNIRSNLTSSLKKQCLALFCWKVPFTLQKRACLKSTSFKIYNSPEALQGGENPLRRREGEKRRIHIYSSLKSWGGNISLHIPFDPIICFMAAAPSEGSSGMQQKF